MKKTFLTITAILLITASCFSQSTEKADYLKKSKNQKTAAFVLLGVGAALDIGGLIITLSNANKEVNYLLSTQTQTENSNVNHGTEYALYIAGTVCLIGSLSLFIASKSNKKRAASVSFKNERAPYLQNSTVAYKPVPSVNLRIRL